MPKNNDSDELLGLTEKIVSAHVSNNAISSADLPDLIKTVHVALANIITAGKSAPTPKPAVPINKSVTANYIVCLEDGQKFKMLKQHRKKHHNTTPKEYRESWGLPGDYPMVAPAYAQQRSELAKKIGLGRKRKNVKAKGKGAGKK